MNIAVINLITRTSLTRKKAPGVQSNRDAMIVQFALALKNGGGNVDVFIADAYRPQTPEDLGVNIRYLPTRLKWIFWPARLPFTPGLCREVRNKYDIVICSEAFQWSTVLAVLAKCMTRRKTIKIVVWQELGIHQRMLKGWPSKFYHQVILKRVMDRFITCYVPRSGRAGKFLAEQGIHPQKIMPPIPHGYNQHVFYYDPAVKKEKYIFSPSRLVYSKGVDVLLKAFALVSKEADDLELVIQGEGPLLKEYTELAGRLGIDGKVCFDTNRINHQAMRERYQKALLTVISSRADNVIFSDMESIACGTPVIISTGADSCDNYQDGIAGICFHSEDEQRLAGLILDVIKNPYYRKKLEREALQKSRQFHIQHLAGQFMNILKTINPGTIQSQQPIGPSLPRRVSSFPS